MLGKVYFVDNATMQKVDSSKIKVGEYAYAFYGADMTKSIPPQAKAFASSGSGRFKFRVYESLKNRR